MGEQPRDLGVEEFRLGQIHQSNRAPADFVLVGGSDAALGGADDQASDLARFPVRVEFAVKRQNQRDVFGDLEVLWRHRHALRPNGVDLAFEVIRVEHHAVADDGQFAGSDDAGGQQRQLEDLVADHQRMAGVVAALETHDHVGGNREPIDDLALAFVAPLSADHHDIRHRRPSSHAIKQNPGPARNALNRGSLLGCPTRKRRLSKDAR
jgi:hypothetical protein